MRKVKFQNEYYYHIYNRGVDKREVFMDEKDYLRFLKSMREFNRLEGIESLYRQDQLKRQAREDTECLRLLRNRRHSVSLVEIICYCLNPNHYHLLLKQLVDNGISKFMHKLGMAYPKYFNEKNNRSGSLFQGPFGAVEIKSGWQLLYVSAYINGNPEIHKIAKADKWVYSSYQDYLGTEDAECLRFGANRRHSASLNKNIILKKFDNIKDYQEYTNEVIKNSKEIKEEIKKCLIE